MVLAGSTLQAGVGPAEYRSRPDRTLPARGAARGQARGLVDPDPAAEVLGQACLHYAGRRGRAAEDWGAGLPGNNDPLCYIEAI